MKSGVLHIFAFLRGKLSGRTQDFEHFEEKSKIEKSKFLHF